jgi:hypothetical protein
VCGIEACPGSVLVANVCEEFTGDTFFRLHDDAGVLVAVNDDVDGVHDSFDDDGVDSSVGVEEGYYYYSNVDDDFVPAVGGCSGENGGEGEGEIEGGGPGVLEVRNSGLCSKIRYVVPATNSSGCRTYFLHQGCYGSSSCSSCSGTTRVAGGIAAPTGQPSGVPTAAPSALSEFKESMFVYSFKTRIHMRLMCDGSRCGGLAELDAAAQQTFLEVFASSMRNVSVSDVSAVKHTLTTNDFTTATGTFATQGRTANASGIEAAIAALSSEIQTSFSSEADALASEFVSRSVALGSVSVTVNSTTVLFLSPE